MVVLIELDLLFVFDEIWHIQSFIQRLVLAFFGSFHEYAMVKIEQMQQIVVVGDEIGCIVLLQNVQHDSHDLPFEQESHLSLQSRVSVDIVSCQYPQQIVHIESVPDFGLDDRALRSQIVNHVTNDADYFDVIHERDLDAIYLDLEDVQT